VSSVKGPCLEVISTKIADESILESLLVVLSYNEYFICGWINLDAKRVIAYFRLEGASHLSGVMGIRRVVDFPYVPSQEVYVVN
jgi:uncharacterized protein YunC (DUF1805 family)